MKEDKTVIIIGGPTAVGKTAVAIDLARALGTEIISADSRQCYRELNIGVARPSGEELSRVRHHFIASHSIHEPVHAASYEAYALSKAAEIFRGKDTVVLVGGTGLYIKAFSEGLDEIPEVSPEIREAIRNGYQAHGLDWLRAQVQDADPEFYAQGEILNPHRLMRALEVKEASGKSILHFRKGIKAERPFRIIKFGIGLPRETLYANINARVGGMLEAGLVAEVRALVPHRDLPALQTVGYKEIFHYLDGKTSLEEAADAIRRNTRHYAKRQLTWFKKDPEYQWGPPDAAWIVKSCK